MLVDSVLRRCSSVVLLTARLTNGPVELMEMSKRNGGPMMGLVDVMPEGHTEMTDGFSSYDDAKTRLRVAAVPIEWKQRFRT